MQQKADRENKTFFLRIFGQKCAKTESAIPLHTCLPCMAGTSQGAFVVTLEASQAISPASYIIREKVGSCEFSSEGRWTFCTATCIGIGIIV